MRKTSALMACLAVMLTAGLLYAGDTSFRCGNDLISVGYTMFQVKKSCGAPDMEEVVGTREVSGTRVPRKGRGLASSDTALNITKWIYSRDFGIYTLTFEGDKLVRKEYTKTN